VKGRCIGVSLFSCFCKDINLKKVKESLPGAQTFWHCVQKRETPQCACLLGSITVEATVIIPLFAGFFSFLLFFFQIMSVQLVIQSTLEETARGLAVLAVNELEKTEEELDYLLLAKGLLSLKLSEEEEILQLVRGGISGVSLLMSEFEQDEILLRADYGMRFPIGFFGIRDFWISQNAYCRKWTGWNGIKEKDEQMELVYITEYGEVYHVKRSCPYLALTIREVLWNRLDKEKNKNGESYLACELCCDENNFRRIVYVTDYGDKYHNKMTCSGLKRTIYQKRFSEVGGMPACGKCAKY